MTLFNLANAAKHTTETVIVNVHGDKAQQDRKTKPCRCEAYSFPHRLYGGSCRGDESNEINSNSPTINCSSEWYESGHGALDFY
jgi:hypothetical protein